jgi:hypothetical protein
MLTADLTAGATLITALGTQITALAGLTGSALTTQQALVLTTGNTARVFCAKLAGELLIQRKANAKAALSALLDYASIPAPAKPLEQYSLGVQAMAGQQALFSDYSSQADKGLASYALLSARYTALEALCTAEPGLITG